LRFIIGNPLSLWWIIIIVLWMGVTLFTYRRLRRIGQRYPRLWMLRFVSFLLLFMLILSPIFVFEKKSKGKLAVLIDNSLSMSIQDPEFPGGRLFTAKKFLEEILPSLEKKFNLRIFTISPGLKEIEKEKLKDLQATGKDTDIDSALRDVRKDNIEAVLLISDGNATSPFKNSPSFPVYTLGIGAKENYPDISIEAISGKKIVSPGENLTLKVRVSNSLNRKVSTTLIVREKDKVIARKDVKLGRGENDLLFNHTFFKQGKYRLQFEVLPVAGDSLPDDNRRNFHVVVMRERAKVFLMAGKISWEVKYLKKLLENNPSYQLKYYIRAGETVFLGEKFPGTEDLSLLIICQLPSPLLPSWGKIKNWLEEGGGLIIIGDSDSFPLQAPPQWEKILPLQGLKGWSPRQLPLAFTSEGKTHPMFSALSNNSLPSIQGALLFTRIPPAGLPLLQVSYQGNRLPVGGLLRYGKGKVFLLGTASTWRWKLKGKVPYSTFWLSIFEYFVPERENMEEGYILYTDKDYYSKGEKVKIMLKAGKKESEFSPRDLKGKVLQGEKSFPLRLLPSAPYMFTATFSPRRTGKYTVQVVTPEGKKSGEFYYGDPFIEWKDTSLKKDFLQELALQTGGQYFSPAASPDYVASQIITKKGKNISRVPTAPALLFYLLILLFLTLEWFLRKKFHLP